MLVSEIVTRVRGVIDELMENDSDFLRESEDEKNLTQIIVDKVGYALQYVIANAPLDKLDDSELSTPTSAETGSGNFAVDSQTLEATFKIPTDCLRIIEARLSSWTHAPIPVRSSSPVALMQQDEYAKGSWDRPVNVLTYGSDGRRSLKMYCARATTDTLVFVFIRKPDTSTISLSTNITVPSQLEASLIYHIAGLVMTAFKDDVAASLFAIAQRHLDPTGERNGE